MPRRAHIIPLCAGLGLLTAGACAAPDAQARAGVDAAAFGPETTNACATEDFDPREAPGPRSSFLETADGMKLHSVVCGDGAQPVVFLHGQPTSAYLWRDVAPAVASLPGYRSIAMDLPGFGRSTAPEGTDYRIETHEEAVDAFLQTLGPEPVVLVGHDWGSYLALRWASRHRERVAGLVMMETILPVGLTRPDRSDALSVRADSVVGAIWAMAGESRSRPGLSEERVADIALGEFLELGTVRELTPEEWDAYRRPFADGDRAPIVALPRQIPREYALDAVRDYSKWLGTTDVPALFFFVEPGVLGNVAQREWVAATLANVTIIDLGAGIHFVQEDHGPAIGRAIADWLEDLPPAGG